MKHISMTDEKKEQLDEQICMDLLLGNEVITEEEKHTLDDVYDMVVFDNDLADKLISIEKEMISPYVNKDKYNIFWRECVYIYIDKHKVSEGYYNKITFSFLS